MILPTKTRPSYSFRRKKHKLRALFRGVSFLALIALYGTYLTVQTDSGRAAVPDDASLIHARNNDDLRVANRRRLDEEGGEEEEADACDNIEVASSTLELSLKIVGVLYMFLGLAIVCDEFFVPALEEMSSSRHMNLSMDVAGATLMAAGGSAPELFTALFATFQESEVGFGTIVGSSVFNVLFVIGMCSLMSREVLHLTWWPLFRDSVYYVISLGVLAYFIGYRGPGEIELVEAVILFGMYLGYVTVMIFNEKLHKLITGKELGSGKSESEEADDYALHETEAPGMSQQNKNNPPPHFLWPSTFRVGVVRLLAHPECWKTTAGAGLVTKLMGSVDDAFKHVDKNNNGSICTEEFQKVMNELDVGMTAEELENTFKEIDTNQSGEISEEEFATWYLNSEDYVLTSVKKIFNQFDTNNSLTIDRHEMERMLKQIEPEITHHHVEDAMKTMHKEGNKKEISFSEFSQWYIHSMVYKRQKEEAEEDMRGIFASFDPPKGCHILQWLRYIIVLPLVATLAFTIPDVRRPGMGRWCYAGFGMSIAWIGVYSYLMVGWAEIVGNSFGIPPIVMGLTIIAAGTSTPDLLSSVIVARMGEGDMAVSSSIGSNIFDILVGLPLPWILYTAYPNTPDTFQIGAEGVAISIIILVTIIIFIIITIHCSGWKLTKSAGIMMFVFYALFLFQAVYRELPFELC